MSVMQLKRGSTASVSAYTPAMAELVLDTTLNQLYIGDGVTAGGYRIAAPLSVQGVSLAAASTPAAARSVIAAAASGANSDINSITGSAASLTTSRSISATGDASWSVNFNGTANATAALTLASVGSAGTYGSVTTDAKGRVTSGSTATPIANGGTGATTAATGLAALGEESAWTNFSLQNGWVVIASRRAAYRKVLGMVQIEFGVNTGTSTDGTLLATLPVGLRPAFQLALPVVSGPNTTPSTTISGPRVIVGTDGTIVCQNCSTAPGITFSALLPLT